MAGDTVRLTVIPQNSTTGEATDPIPYEVSHDGQTFAFGVNQKRVLPGDPNSWIVQSGPTIAVLEDNSLSGKQFPSTHPSRT